MNYSIIIPAYNEEARISATIHEYSSFIQKEMPAGNTELLIIVNGSSDQTGEIARDLEKTYPWVRVWETPEKQGKGGAVMKGFDLAEGDIVAFTDADNATTASELKKLLDRVGEGVDCAIGSRWLPESHQAIPQPLARRIASRVFNLIVRMLFQLPYRDTQCGAKAFCKDAIQAIQDEIRVSGWAFDVALLWRLRKHGYHIEEVPISWSDNSKSRLRMHRDGPAMLIELLKLRFGK